MSNPLSVRRVKVQTINERGEPEGEPTYGVMASDDNAGGYNDTFESLEDLNKAIEEEGSILKIVDAHHDLFPDANHAKIGTGNYYGKDWFYDDEEDYEEDESSSTFYAEDCIPRLTLVVREDMVFGIEAGEKDAYLGEWDEGRWVPSNLLLRSTPGFQGWVDKFVRENKPELPEQQIFGTNGEVPLDGGPGFQPGDPGYPE